MKKIWKFIGVMVIVILVLGGICAGVGFLTGADGARIFGVLDAEYNITASFQAYSATFQEMMADLTAAVSA